MRRRAGLALALLVAAPTAVASEGFVAGGVGVARRELDEGPLAILGLEYDDGTVLAAQVGTHYDTGLMLRVDYTYTYYDALTAVNGTLVLSEDIQQQETRFGVFYATPVRAPVRLRWGGGYVYADEDAESQDSRYQDGGFLEGAVAVDAGKRVTFELAAAALKLDGPQDYDAETTAVSGGVALHLGDADLTLDARYAETDREDWLDEERLELRLGVRTAWNYPESRW